MLFVAKWRRWTKSVDNEPMNRWQDFSSFNIMSSPKLSSKWSYKQQLPVKISVWCITLAGISPDSRTHNVSQICWCDWNTSQRFRRHHRQSNPDRRIPKERGNSEKSTQTAVGDSASNISRHETHRTILWHNGNVWGKYAKDMVRVAFLQHSCRSWPVVAFFNCCDKSLLPRVQGNESVFLFTSFHCLVSPMCECHDYLLSCLSICSK